MDICRVCTVVASCESGRASHMTLVSLAVALPNGLASPCPSVTSALVVRLQQLQLVITTHGKSGAAAPRTDL